MAARKTRRPGANEHDTLFRIMVEDERRADILIRECLPAGIAQQLGKTRGRRVDGTYADILGVKQSDALYEFKAKGKAKGKERSGKSNTILVLVEHKSHPDSTLKIQYGLVDLVRLKRKEMSQDPGLRALQTAMQKIRRNKKPTGETLATILKDLPLDLEATAMSYILKVADIDRATLDEAAEIAKPERKEKLMGTFVQECWQEAKSDMVTHMLEKRFGALPDAERAQVAAASEEQLDAWVAAWVDSGITAESPQEALGA